MKDSTRPIINTLAQNIRSILNVGLALYSTRIVLEALGQNDYGIFTLVAGVITMLGFITNAMLVSTQRFLSFLHGQGNESELRKFFSNSLFLHFVMGAGLSLIFIILEPLVMSHLLVIDSDRLHTAEVVYFIMSVNLLTTFITAPYRALFIARENIVYISIVDVLDGVLKLGLVFLLFYVGSDRLIVYSIIVTGIMIFNLLAFVLYAKSHYAECVIIPRIKDIERSIILKMTDFTGWTIYSTGCFVGRVQGVAILLNRAFGTIINSAYGIGMQVSGSVQFIAASVQNAMSPQIVKAEGRNDRETMLLLAERTSKYCYLLLCLVVVPLVFEMPEILRIWLHDVPEHTDTFCSCILITSLVDQMTIGLGMANQAVGRIRNYSITINSIKLLTLPVVWVLLHYGYGIMEIMIAYILIELLCALMRIPFLHYTIDISVGSFIRSVIMKIIPPTIAMILMSYITTSMFYFPCRFLLTGIASVIVSMPVIWYLCMEKAERDFILNLISRK